MKKMIYAFFMLFLVTGFLSNAEATIFRSELTCDYVSKQNNDLGIDLGYYLIVTIDSSDMIDTSKNFPSPMPSNLRGSAKLELYSDRDVFIRSENATYSCSGVTYQTNIIGDGLLILAEEADWFYNWQIGDVFQEHFSDYFLSVTDVSSYSSNPVPEPATIVLFLSGIAGIAGSKFRKKTKQNY